MNGEQAFGFYEAEVLAWYQREADKYIVETDHFHGKLTLTGRYADDLDPDELAQDSIEVLFGYRKLRSGELALVVFRPAKLKSHLRRWQRYEIHEPDWHPPPDERFDLWYQVFIRGDWSVGNPPILTIESLVSDINTLTDESLGCPLFQVDENPSLQYPAAENSHAYQDAHGELYKWLIDGLSKDCIVRIAEHTDSPVNLASNRTVRALKRVLSGLPEDATMWKAFDLISERRRDSAHSVRDTASPFDAFASFHADLQLLVEGLEELSDSLEQVMGMTVIQAQGRWIRRAIDRSSREELN